MPVSLETVDKALEFLRESADKAAKAKAERLYLEEFRKSKKALLMSKRLDQPVNAQERDAYADHEYIEFLSALRTAIEADEYYRFKREAASAMLEAWRTQQANLRAEGKAFV